MKVFVSNQLEELADRLQNELLDPTSHPFTHKWVIVPNLETKRQLRILWAQRGGWEVVAGINILSWEQFLRECFPHLLSPTELFLRINQQVNQVQDEELICYLSSGGTSRRIRLCEQLAQLFARYMVSYEQVELGGWQQVVWERVSGSMWNQKRFLYGKIYLFHCMEMAPFHKLLLQQMGAQCFIFSPCSLYWGDLKTGREQKYTLEQANDSIREELALYFQNDHILLSQWGKRGREFLRLFEEEEQIESFRFPHRNTLLSQIQEEILTLSALEKTCDDSIQIHAAPSKLKEVEIVWELIQKERYLPSEIIVVAPNIQEYGRAIDWVFQSKGGSIDYAISGLEQEGFSPLIRGMQSLLALPSNRFSKEIVDGLLVSPPFLKRFRFSSEEGQELQKWFRLYSIRYDLRETPNSWHEGLKRIVESIAIGKADSSIDPLLLSRWIEIIEQIESSLQIVSQEWTLAEWAQQLQQMARRFFCIDPEDDSLIHELEQWKHLRVEGLYGYSVIESLLHKIYKKPSHLVHPSHLQAVRCMSLEQATCAFAKVVIIMGMEEGKFPLPTTVSSLQKMPLPSSVERDQYLFLQILMQAKEKVFITYTYLDPEDGKSQKVSSLVQEFIHYCACGITTHPLPHLGSSFPRKESIPILPPTNLPTPQHDPTGKKKKELFLTTSALRQLARHPLQYFFDTRMGIHFRTREPEEEFSLSPITSARLRTNSLPLSGENGLEELTRSGILPVGIFGSMTLSRMEQEIREYQDALERFAIDHFFSVELRHDCTQMIQVDPELWIHPAVRVEIEGGTVIVEGRLSSLSSKGLIVHGENHRSTRRKMWPLFLLVKQLYTDMPILFTKAQKPAGINVAPDALVRYLQYAIRAQHAPSPLFPHTKPSDPIIEWAKRRSLLPESWEEVWRTYLETELHELI